MNLETLFLKSKHWQLFLMFIALSIVSQIAFLLIMIINRHPISGIIAGLAFLVFIGWFFIIIKFLDKKINNPNLKIYNKHLVYFLIFTVIYITLVFWVFPQGFTISTEGSDVDGFWQLLIIPAHLFSMFSIFYLMYKAARTIKTVELQRKVTFGDFAGEFFLLWFFPIGIWIIQPKINKFAE